MSDDAPEPETQAALRLTQWEFERYLALGVGVDDAALLAAQHGLSWHDVGRLIRSGCPPSVAARIVA